MKAYADISANRQKFTTQKLIREIVKRTAKNNKKKKNTGRVKYDQIIVC